jgi:UDP-N-acetylglucosamine 2-epimerase (non-hydrolysing)
VKLITLFGTRPEIIRLSQVIKVLDPFCEQVLVHTGQNYDPQLSDVFFRELDLRPPDHYLGVQANGFAEQASQILNRVGAVLEQAKPDRLLVLGDTNSALAALVAARMGIPVYHMEAGNRCYDNRVPEEINRRVIDHCSDVLMPYTHRSKENLLREGIARQRIFVIGNPIYEVLQVYRPQTESSDILNRLNLAEGRYFLVTLHRAENVDDPVRLEIFLHSLKIVADDYREPVIVSVHPHTARMLDRLGLKVDSDLVRLMSPMGFFDFVKLELHAHCVLSDSGTVQEECCIFGVPNVTLRDVTERAETVEVGSNILSGANAATILRSVKLALHADTGWTAPKEYLEPHVSRAVSKIVLGCQIQCESRFR